MRTRGFVAVFAIMLNVVFCPFVMADIFGSWDVAGRMKTKVKIKGYGSDSVKEYVVDSFKFDEDGNFSTLDFDQATWEYGKKKVFVNFNTDELSLFFEQELEDLFWTETGYDVDVYDVTIVKNVLYAKEKKNESIKGKWKLVFTCRMDIDSVGILNIKTWVKYGFTGTRAGAPTTLSEQRALSEGGDSLSTLSEAIEAQVLNRVFEFLPEK